MTDVRSARTGGADYRPLNESTLAPYLAGFSEVAAILGGAAQDWKVTEVGDGNLNLVFIVRGPKGALIVKQALPYVRLVGDSWPLPLDRSFFETQALITQGNAAPGLVPKVVLFDAMQALVVMEFLTPHIIMRKGLIDGVEFPRFAATLSEFMAQSLFKTSDLYLPAAEKKKQMAVFCANTELCRINRGSGVHRPLQGGQAQSLDLAAARRHRLGVPCRRPAQGGSSSDEAQVPISRRGAGARGPALRLDHGDQHRCSHHRSGIRLLRPDGFRHRRA